MRSEGGGGKRKRKAETNFVDAYSGASELAPPPNSKDVSAIPSKLRKIIQLRASIAGGAQNGPEASPRRPGKGSDRKTSKAQQDAKKRSAGGDIDSRNGLRAGMSDQSVANHTRGFGSRWKKGEEQLKVLVEKMDKRAKTGIRAGVGERRKSYLNERKKKKGKWRKPDEDNLPAFHQFDKVEFGDVVQAPPKLSFPKKAAEIKVKEKQRGEQATLRERLRLEAIESYRARKEWSSRPGGLRLPILNLTDAEI